MNICETMTFINSYSKSGKAVTDLSRARELMERLGNPEKQLKFVHVAGTNGKGSTVEYISDALIFSGYKTGQFTSPYITHYADRIRINGEEIDEISLCEIAETVKKAVADAEYSQFEITMAIAFLWYVRERCDIVVLEVGIGGLLDCTNVIPPPILAVITSISLDHTGILGDTVEKIAEQKAGIIKKGSAVVLSGHQSSDEVEKVVYKTAERVGAEIIPLETCTPTGTDSLRCSFICNGIEYTPAMAGVHQLINAETAITACRYLSEKGFDISETALKKAIETARINARVQYIDGNPPVIVDGAHNPDGVSALADDILLKITRKQKAYIVIGMMNSKDYTECVNIIAPYGEKIWTVSDFAYGTVPAEKLAEVAGKYADAEASTLHNAVENAKKTALENNGIVIICGSLYLASEYLKATSKNLF